TKKSWSFVSNRYQVASPAIPVPTVDRTSSREPTTPRAKDRPPVVTVMMKSRLKGVANNQARLIRFLRSHVIDSMYPIMTAARNCLVAFILLLSRQGLRTGPLMILWRGPRPSRASSPHRRALFRADRRLGP